jgi:hypothetical protein
LLPKISGGVGAGSGISRLVRLSYLRLPADVGLGGSLKLVLLSSETTELLWPTSGSIILPSLSLSPLLLAVDCQARLAALLVTGFSSLAVFGVLGFDFLLSRSPDRNVCSIVLFSGLGLRLDFFIGGASMG